MRTLCVLDALLLEGAFTGFILAPSLPGATFLPWLALSLSGCSLASLFLLWFLCRSAESTGADLFGFACALLTGFMICLLRSALPPFALGPLYPPLTAIPLFIALGQKDPVPLDAPHAARSLPQSWHTLALFALTGFGIGILGHNATNADYAAGFAGLVLLGICFCRPSIVLSLVEEAAAPCMMCGLCLGLLAEPGAPFSIFGTGCMLVVSYELARHRHINALCGVLCAGTGLSIAGLAAAHFCASLLPTTQIALILMAFIVVGAAWHISRRVRDREDSEPLVPRAADTLVTSPTPPAAASPWDALKPYRLSSREAEVAAFLLENRSVGFICATLHLSQSTVKTHIRHIYEKTGVHSRDELQLLICRERP